MKKEIMERLERLTILDFKENYNKNEIQRIVSNKTNEEIKELKEYIINELYKEYDKDKYHIYVSSSYIQISEITEKKETSMMVRVIDTIYSNAFSKLPYGWVMGKPISKKAMQETLTLLED